MSTVISVENLGKKYTISHQNKGDRSSLREVITNGISALGRRILSPFTGRPSSASSQEDFWALKDVTFEVKQGDRIGIIGRNGAGKSTLLKILSRITEPTTGCVRIKGRVASLLEVGTGFHPELTGRENIYLNGAVLGMSRQEIQRKFDEIVAFAEIEKFLDTPVKRYSSGMYVRLAFAVAAHLEPEILIVDEVLAVGDAQFQKKCLGKMEEVGREGRTVLFVSHNMPSIRALCSRALGLYHGEMVADGDPESVISSYLSSATPQNGIIYETCNAIRSAGRTKAIKSAWLENVSGETVSHVLMGDTAILCFRYELEETCANLDFGFGIETMDGFRVFSVNHTITGGESLLPKSHGVAKCKISSIPLVPGSYLVSLSIVDSCVEWIDYIERAISFNVVANDVYGTGKLFEKTQGVVFVKACVNVSDN